MHALIIEDEPLVAFAIQDHLSELGFTSFDLAATEQAAVQRARERYPDLIAADVCLLEGTGITAVQEICRQRPAPVMFITGSCESVTAVMPDAVVVAKPVNSSDLRLAYRVALDQYRLGKGSRPPA
jgi:DNA-binding response OmpR family regulator